MNSEINYDGESLMDGNGNTKGVSREKGWEWDMATISSSERSESERNECGASVIGMCGVSFVHISR